MPDDPRPDDPEQPVPLHGAAPDDELTRRLRGALGREAERIRPGDRLDAILDRVEDAPTRDQARRRRSPWPALVAAACVLVVLAGGVVVGLRFIGHSGPMSGEPVSAEAASGAAQRSGAPSRAADTGAAAARVAVFAVGGATRVNESSTAPRGVLYREFRAVTVTRDPLDRVAEAVAELAVTPQDPDYRTAWSGMGAPGVTLDSGVLVVTVDLPAQLPAGITPTLAAQQLVWTAVAAYGQDAAVRLDASGTVPGWADGLVGVVLHRDAAVRAAIWIDSPEQGTEVAAGPVTVTGESTSFEAALNWKVVDAAGREVDSGTTSGGANGDYAPFRFSVDLPAGDYTVSVYVLDQLTGRTVTDIDTKTFTVR